MLNNHDRYTVKSNFILIYYICLLLVRASKSLVLTSLFTYCKVTAKVQQYQQKKEE